MSKKNMKTTFDGWDEPVGARIQLLPLTTARRMEAALFFDGLMKQYLHELSAGQTGWGVSFNSWLHMMGWKLVSFRTYERVVSVDEDCGEQST